MNLKRKGTNRDSGYRTAFKEKNPSISHEKDSGELSLTVSKARGMGPEGQYDYVVTLSPNDISEILKFIAIKGLSFENGPLRDSIVNSSHVILQLLMGSSGLQLSIVPEKGQPKPIKVNMGTKP